MTQQCFIQKDAPRDRKDGGKEAVKGRRDAQQKQCSRRFTFRNQPPTASSPTMFAHVGSNKVRPKFLDATVFYPIDVKPI